MIEVLPRLHLLRQAGEAIDDIDHFIVNFVVSKFHKEMPARIGIPQSKLIESHWTPHVLAERLLVPALAGIMGFKPRWACEYLRELFSDCLAGDPPGRRIYITRRAVGRRSIVEEYALIDRLAELDIETIDTAQLSVAEQPQVQSPISQFSPNNFLDRQFPIRKHPPQPTQHR